MRSISYLALVLLVCFSFYGCAMVQSPVGQAGIVTNLKGPLTATGIKGTKTGTASCESYLGIVALGDCSIEAAMKNGGITKVSSVDYESFSVIVFYSKYTVVVTGE